MCAFRHELTMTDGAMVGIDVPGGACREQRGTQRRGALEHVDVLHRAERDPAGSAEAGRQYEVVGVQHVVDVALGTALAATSRIQASRVAQAG